MNCCTNCFNDKEIIGFIFTNSTAKGTCDFCATIDVPLVDARELEEMFQPIIALFRTVARLDIAVPEKKLLRQKVQDMWNFFRLPEANHQQLLVAILRDSIPANDPVLNEPVEIEVLFNPALMATYTKKNGRILQKKLNIKTDFF